MSLSSHLRNKRSPVNAWLAEQFPNTRSVVKVANHSLTGKGECRFPPPVGSDLSLVGTAIDYQLRACLRADGLERPVAATGASMLSAFPGIGGRAMRLFDETVSQIGALEPWGLGEMFDEDWRLFSELCLVLARFEQYRRNPQSPAVRDKVLAPLMGYNGTALGLIQALAIEESSIEDLVMLGRAAWSDTRDLQDAEPLYLNPHFRLSVPLGGADADLIYGNTLRDWKSSATPSIVGREALWQLLGYALADSDDAFQIHHVEISALRWEGTVGWSLPQLIAELAPGPPDKLSVLRASFADVVIDAGRVDHARGFGL